PGCGSWDGTKQNPDRKSGGGGGQDGGHRRVGTAILAVDDGERALLIESEHLLHEDGFEARWDGTRLINPRDGEVDPAAMVAALARQARPGAIREGVDVSGLHPRAHDVMVTAGDDSCDAGIVILATNAYTPELGPPVKSQPTRAQMLATVPQSTRITDMPVYSNFGYRYWRQLPTGELLIGGWRDTSLETEKTYGEEPTTEIQEQLDRASRELGASGEVTHRWAGSMGFTESGLALAGPLAGLPRAA